MRAKSSPHAVISLFRFWLPSWKFFVEIGPEPQLHYRIGAAHGEFGPWHPCFDKRTRRWRELFLNAEGNFQLACGNLLAKLMQDIAETSTPSSPDETDRISGSVTYRLIENLVRLRIGETFPAEADHRRKFQFKISLVSPRALSQPSGPELDDILFSPELEV